MATCRHTGADDVVCGQPAQPFIGLMAGLTQDSDVDHVYCDHHRQQFESDYLSTVFGRPILDLADLTTDELQRGLR